MPHKNVEARKAYRRKHYKDHPEVRRRQCEASNVWRKSENGLAASKRSKERHIKHRSYMKQRYGLTVEMWERKLIAQAGRCAMCCEPMQRPCVDHNHETGQIRDMLCTQCNQAVGWIESEQECLDLAKNYVRHWGSKSV